MEVSKLSQERAEPEVDNIGAPNSRTASEAKTKPLSCLKKGKNKAEKCEHIHSSLAM